MREDENSEPVAPPVVDQGTVEASEVFTAKVDPISGTVAVQITSPVEGLTYTAKDKDGKVLGTATATAQDVTDGELFIDTTTATADDVAKVTNNRLSIAGTTINFKLFSTDDLKEISKQFVGASLDKDAVAIVPTSKGEVKVNVPKDGAITAILNTLTENNKNAADLVGKTFEITLVDPADVDKADRKETKYTIKFN